VFFLHLITDYLFFNDFIEKDYILNINYDEFCKDLYYSYDLVDDYLLEKYNINYSSSIEQITLSIDKNRKEKKINRDQTGKNILDFLMLDRFIEKVSNVDLEKYKSMILKADTNIFP